MLRLHWGGVLGAGWFNCVCYCVSAVMVVVKVDGLPYLCKTDEVGELCVCSGYTGVGYGGLDGLTAYVIVFQL